MQTSRAGGGLLVGRWHQHLGHGLELHVEVRALPRVILRQKHGADQPNDRQLIRDDFGRYGP